MRPSSLENKIALMDWRILILNISYVASRDAFCSSFSYDNFSFSDFSSNKNCDANSGLEFR
jgi:hypothetical protein